jgi:hypothetical protein
MYKDKKSGMSGPKDEQLPCNHNAHTRYWKTLWIFVDKYRKT